MRSPTWPLRVFSLFVFALPMLSQEVMAQEVMARETLLATPPVQPAAIAAIPRIGSREQPSARVLYRWSVATVLAANVADATSSWQNREANPLVAGPTAQFGMTSVAIKSGFVGVSLLMQHFVLRHNPGAAKRLAWMNFATSGVLGGVALHNASLR